jgi:hypothetical protein
MRADPASLRFVAEERSSRYVLRSQGGDVAGTIPELRVRESRPASRIARSGRTGGIPREPFNDRRGSMRDVGTGLRTHPGTE